MKIGLISDIHADLASLNRALAILEREAVDLIICAGDLVERGLEGDAVVEIIRTHGIPCVRGNHDVDALFNQGWLRKNMDSTTPEAKARLLTDETLAFLKTLPEELRFTWAGMRVLVTHGVPGDFRQYLWEYSPDAEFKAIAMTADADIIIAGHTHEPMRVRQRAVWFLNPGTLFTGHGERATCATLSLPDCTFTVFNVADGEPIALE